MRIWIFAIVALVIGVLLGVSTTSYELAGIDERFEVRARSLDRIDTPETNGTPHAVVIGGETADLDLIPKNGIKSHIFKIRNDGDGVLQLQRHTVSCGLCVHTDFETGAVQPGEEIGVEVKLRARKPGPLLNESLELRTNDPQRSHITLNLSAFITEPARLDTEDLRIGVRSSDSEGTAVFHVHGFYSDDLEILKHEFTVAKNREFYEMEFRKMTPEEIKEVPRAKSGIEVTVRLKKGHPIGPLQQSIHLVARSGDQQEIELNLPIIGAITGDIYFLPMPGFHGESSSLLMGKIERGKGETKTLHILVKGPYRQDVKLSVGLTDPENILRAEIGEPKVISDGKIWMYPLNVSVAKDAPPITRLPTAQSKPGKIIIKTTHPTIDELPLFVRFLVE